MGDYHFQPDGGGESAQLAQGSSALTTPDAGKRKLRTKSDGWYDVDDAGVENKLATKAYVDAVKQGLDVKDSVRVATAAALPANTRTGNILTASANGALAVVDGVTLALNDRLLVKDEAAGANNGLYTVTALGSISTPWTMTRAEDADVSSEVTAGLYVWAEEGAVNQDSGWVLSTNNPITLNTTALAFAQFTGAGMITAGAGLTKTGNTLDVGAGDGIQADVDSMTVKLDGVSLEKAAAGLKRAALTGDVTAASGGNATAIANNAVTYAKMQDVSATDKVLGRASVGAGDPEEIICTAAGRALIDDVDAAAQRTTLGLGSIATVNSPVPVANGGTGQTSFKTCRAYHSVAQSIANATFTAVALDSEQFDTDTMHDTVTNNSRITFRTARKHIVIAQVAWANNATGQRIVRIVLNGVTVIAEDRSPPAGGESVKSIPAEYDMAANDYVEIFVYQDSGGALNINSLNFYSPVLSAARLGD